MASVLTKIVLSGPTSGIATHQVSGTYTVVGYDQNNAIFPFTPTFNTSLPGTATIANTGVAQAVAAGTTSITAVGLNSLGTTITSNAITLTVVAQQVTTVIIAGPTSVITTHTTTAYTAQAFDQLGTAMSGQSYSFASGTPATATINGAGIATGVAVGNSSITATAAGVTSATPVTLQVIAQSANSVTLTPSSATIAAGATQQFTATVFDQGSPSNPIGSAVVSWSSTASGVATVNATGLVTGVAGGSATIMASSGGKSATSPVTVSAAGITSITSTPSSINAQAGSQQQLVIKDNTGTDVTSQCTFASSAPTVAYADYVPSITSVTPNFIAQSATNQSVSIAGTNFTSTALGQSVTFSSLTGLTIVSTTFNSSTLITLVLSATGSAPTGGRTIRITDTGHGNSNTIGFSVTGVTPTVPITSGLVLQLRADAGVATSGAAVTTWTDQSATGAIFSQATASQRPTLIAAAQNGLPIVRFDGSDDVLSAVGTVSALNGSAYALFSVGKRTSGAGDSLMFSNNNVTGNTGWGIGDTTTLTLYYGNGSAVTTLNDTNGLGFQFDQVTWILNPSATNKLEIRRNGTSVAVANGTFVPQTTLAPTVGALNNPSGYVWNGDLSEVLIYDLTVNNLTLSNMQTIESYLKSKWGTP